MTSDWTVDGIIHGQSGLPINLTIPTNTVVDGVNINPRPDLVLGQPLYIEDGGVAGGRRFNILAFRNPPTNPNFPNVFQQGSFGRNVLRALPVYQVDMSLGRNVIITEKAKIQFKIEVFNIFNHPNFGSYGTSLNSLATFGVPFSTLHNSLGNSTSGVGLSSLYQLGGPRSIQLSARFTF